MEIKVTPFQLLIKTILNSENIEIYQLKLISATGNKITFQVSIRHTRAAFSFQIYERESSV